MSNILKLTYFGHKIDVKNLFYLSKSCLHKSSSSNKIIFNKTLSKKEVADNYINNLNLFKKILPFITQDLNKYHKVQYSEKFWNTVLGWWLLDHIKINQEIFHKLHKIDPKDFSSYINFNFNEVDIKLYDFEDSIDKFKQDQWSQYAHQRAINYFHPSIKKSNFDTKKVKKNLIFKNNIKKLFNYFIFFYNIIFVKIFSKKISFLNHYFNINQAIKIFISLKSLPLLKYFNTTNESSNFHIYNLNKRLNFFRNFKPNNNFEIFYYKTLIEDMPIAIVENFHDTFALSTKRYPLNKYNVIFTSQSHFFDTNFKISAAYFREVNSLKLFILQHGGSYYFSDVDVHLYWEKQISDIFFSWGTFTNAENIKPLGQNRIKKINNYPDYILIILDDINRNYSCYLTPNSDDLLYYLDDISLLIKHLSKKFKVVVRLPHNNLFYKKYLKKINNSIIFDNNKNSFKSYKKASLVISCAFATSALETIVNNIPTIVYIPKKLNYFNFNTVDDKIINEIYFDNYLEIVKKLCSDNFFAKVWWNENNNKVLVNKFIKKYCDTNKNLDKDIKKYLKNEI